MKHKVNVSTISQEIGIMMIMYFALFCISKGLNKKRWDVRKKLFLKLPQSSLSNLSHNYQILGLRSIKYPDNTVEDNLSSQVFLVKSHMPIFQDGICPFMRRGVIGKDLNEKLYSSMIDFLELLYSQILQHYEREYENTSTYKTPDFVNILLGRFEIDETHLGGYPQFFQKNNLF